MISPFETLRSFISQKMRMSHIYQPVMLKTLIEHGGSATLREIAAAFLSRDESQLEYYEEITKRMPGKVLARHDLVERTPDGYQLLPAVEDLSADQRKELLQLCDEAVERYLERRGQAAYDHRRAALGYVSGSIRYEVLKRSGGRCMLCGVSIDERAIEIDHIIPRRHGGSDAPENLQALCYKCNANKGARDDTDFRLVVEGQNRAEKGCLFCGGCKIACNIDPAPKAFHHVDIIAKRRELQGCVSRPIVTPPNSTITQQIQHVACG